VTYGEMTQEIIDELERPDLVLQTQRMILEAISHFKDTRFPANIERNWTFTAGDFTNGYADLPVDFSYDIKAYTEHGNNRHPLRKLGHIELEDYRVTAETGEPELYAINGLELRVWPAPTTQSVRMYGISNLAPPVNDEDTSFWTQDAAQLIKYYAKGLLFNNVLYAYEQAERQMELAIGSQRNPNSELLRLLGKVERQVLGDSVTPHIGGARSAISGRVL
jgi:hypothetical protein